ncbi:hypothetical protein Mapa_014555 [Marchantia paleacea]|nr:hypothetical protein Mapa_014555 [Marchantia paleacea]
MLCTESSPHRWTSPSRSNMISTEPPGRNGKLYASKKRADVQSQDTKKINILSPEPIQSSSLSLQRVHHIHGSDSLSPCVLRICHRISNHILQKNLQNPASLLINQPADSLHSSSSGQTPDGGLGNPLNIISEHLPVTLGASLAQTFTSLSASRHSCDLIAFEG